jgi:hypothetical protein
MMTIVEIHTREEIEAEIEKLRPSLAMLINDGIIRSWCIEDDLRVEAYNRLTERKPWPI